MPYILVQTYDDDYFYVETPMIPQPDQYIETSFNRIYRVDYFVYTPNEHHAARVRVRPVGEPQRQPK